MRDFWKYKKHSDYNKNKRKKIIMEENINDVTWLKNLKCKQNFFHANEEQVISIKLLGLIS